MDCQRIAQILIRKFETECAEDVSAVVLYRVSSETRAGCYLIPKTGDGQARKLERAFLVKGHGVQIEAYDWEELEQAMTGDRLSVNLLLDAKLVWACDEQTENRFSDLCTRAIVTEPSWMMEQFDAVMAECRALYFKLFDASSDAVQTAAFLFRKISGALLLRGNSYLHGGLDTLSDEVVKLPDIPVCYAEVSEKLTETADPQVLQGLLRKLLMQTQKLAASQSEEVLKVPAAQAYTGVYEQAKVWYECITECCFSGKAEGALQYACQLQELLDAAAKRSQQAPQLANLLDLYYRKDLASFAVAMYAHEASLIGFLLGCGISFEQYANIERFEEEIFSAER